MDLRKENKVIRVNFAGGLFGLVFGSHKGKLQKEIDEHNKNGWNYVDSLPDDPNLILIILRLILLTVTLGIWTLGVGYILIFERPRERLGYSAEDGQVRSSGPILTAKR